MQIKEKCDFGGTYDYSICGDCKLRKKICEVYQVICGPWFEKVKADKREIIRQKMARI